MIFKHDFESWWYAIIGMMLRNNGEYPQILLFEDAELKTTYNMEDLIRQGKGGIISRASSSPSS